MSHSTQTTNGRIRLRTSSGFGSAASRSGATGTVGHGTIRLLGRDDVAMVAAGPPETVGHGTIHLGRRPNTAVAQLFADATTAAKDDIISVLVNGGREG